MEVRNLERQIHNLKVSFWGLVLVLLISVLGWFGARWIRKSAEGEPRVSRTGDKVRFSILNDGPFVLTHLEATGESTGDLRWAPLDPPIAVLDSAGAEVNLAGRQWFDYRGDKSDPPSKESKIGLLYYRPERVETLDAP